MFNNIFQQNPQQNPTGYMGMGGVNPMGSFGFPQNNGMSFNNIAPAKTSTSTPEEMAIIKASKKNDFTVTPEELAKFGWDLREGSNLAIEIVDPTTERVKIKYTGEEFNIVVQPVEVLNGYLEGLSNFSYTTALMDTTDSPEVLKELLTAVGVVRKLLPIAYENGKKNYNNVYNQMQNLMSSQGYQGTWGSGQQMFNGSIGAVPNYIINDSGNNMMMGMGMNPMQMQQMQQQQMMQAAAMGAQAAQQQMMNNGMNPYAGMGMGMPTAPNGGTMMGAGVGNPFTQQGMPQQMPAQGATPSLNSIPAPGVTQNTANPAMGGANNTTTTNTVKI